MITEINSDNFEREALKSELPAAAEFTAPWCGYCRRLEPVFKRVAEQYGDKLNFVKINVDDNGELARAYKVDVIPTLILFKDGKAAASIINPESQAAIEDWLRQNGAL